MPNILRHVKEIEMAFLGTLVRYTIPMYFEQRYVMLQNHTLYMKGGNLIVELPVIEKISSPSIECLERERSFQLSTKLK